MSDVLDTRRRIAAYCEKNGLVIGGQLGFGVHGTVFSAKRQIDGRPSAVKVHERERFYLRERNVYRRLREFEVTYIEGAAVPELLGFDDELYVIEMTIVSRPFVLDFAGAYLDFPPDYSEEVMADWNADKQEQFGSRWADAQAILGELESYGIFMSDVNPGNISFGD